jgi:hypothetical protein
MLIRTITRGAAAAVLTISICGCAGTGQMVQTANGPMPDYCMGNNTASGAVIGTLLGAALGAAVGGGRGAAIGAGAGMVAGGLTGAQVDSNCRQAAAQQAMQMALAQQAAMLSRQSSAAQYGPLQVSEAPIPYIDSTGHHHSVQVTQLNSYADPAGNRLCTSGTGNDADLDGKTNAAIAAPRMCRGADGKWVQG